MKAVRARCSALASYVSITFCLLRIIKCHLILTFLKITKRSTDNKQAKKETNPAVTEISGSFTNVRLGI